jgi:hypothetical protein
MKYPPLILNILIQIAIFSYIIYLENKTDENLKNSKIIFRIVGILVIILPLILYSPSYKDFGIFEVSKDVYNQLVLNLFNYIFYYSYARVH